MRFCKKKGGRAGGRGPCGRRHTKFGWGLLALSTVFLATGVGGPARAEVAALVFDPDSGAFPYAYRADAAHQPASLTKIMTLYIAFEALRDGRLKPGQRLKVSRAAARQRPSRLGLRPGRTIRIEDAILALITKSANDASVVIAEAVAGSESAFAARMTGRARALGMSSTVFRNASGLYHRDQVTTARDMGRLAVALIRDFPGQYRLFATKSFVWHGRRYRNHNPMLSSYDGADGVKTGYIRQSGYNLVASARRDGRRLFAVVLGGRNIAHRDWMMTTILDYGFGRAGTGTPPDRDVPLRYAIDSPDGTAFTAALRNIGLPPPEQEKIGSPDDKASQDGKWSIQVGAYRSALPAEEAATAAADRIPGTLGRARVLVMRIVRNGERIYRARLTGLSEGDARKSCRQLARHGIPCLAVADTGEFRKVSVVR